VKTVLKTGKIFPKTLQEWKRPRAALSLGYQVIPARENLRINSHKCGTITREMSA
jgi:hypothetical protein